ncbi:AI-2E family transporter [candidate division KSB1 bacterium]
MNNHPGQPASAPENSLLHWMRNILILIVIGFIFWKILPPLKGIIIMFTLAMLFAYLLEPLVNDLENRGIPRIYSIFILYIAIGCLFYAAGYFLYNPLKAEIGDFVKTVREGKLLTLTDRIKAFVLTNFSFVQEDQLDQILQESINNFRNEIITIAQRTLSFIQSAFSLFTQIFIIPLIAFFILKDGPRIKKELISFMPNRFFEMSLHLLYKTDGQIGKYIRGQLLDTFILAVLYSIGFSYLGIPYAIVLGAFSGVANIIPYVGPIFAAIPPILVTIIESESFNMVPITIVLFVVVQIIEVVLIQPTVVAKSVDIHPLILIFAVLAGGQILGVAGMLFAVLLTGVIKVIIMEITWSYRNYKIDRL